MKNSTFWILMLCLFISFGFKTTKNKSPKEDILYTKYGGNIDSMLAGERKRDSLERPYLHQSFEDLEEIKTNAIDDESIIYEKVEKMPIFENGNQGLTEYLKTATTFIADTLVGKNANVIVKFYINTFGDAKNPKIIKTDNPAFDLQTILIIENMPKWEAATQNGKAVNCYQVLPIKFGQ